MYTIMQILTLGHDTRTGASPDPVAWFKDFLSTVLGIKPGAAGSRSKNAIHCAMLPSNAITQCLVSILVGFLFYWFHLLDKFVFFSNNLGASEKLFVKLCS